MTKYIQCVQNDNKNVTPQETIYAIKNAGFDGAFLQWYNKDWDFSQQEQLNLCRKLGLEIPFVHLGYKGINNIWLEGEDGENLVKNYLNDLDVCKSNNLDMVVMHLTSKSIAPEPNLIGVERLQRIVDYAEQLNIKVAFENTKIYGYLEYVFKHIKNSNAGICYDAGHCHCHFNDKFSWDMFKNKIFAVHLHDNDKSDDLHLLPFEGTIDWKELSNNLKKANYTGPITLESCYRYDYLNMTIEDFYKLSLEKAKQINLQKKLNNIQEKKTPKTFLAVLDKTYNEVIISKYLAYFLDERKTSRTIIENILKQTSKNESVDFVELLESANFESIETEIHISRKDRLDILIKYSNFWIVIENKIYAFESKDNQTVNYEKQIKNANTNKLPVKFIYLKPEFNKSKPSNPKFIEFLYKDLVVLFQQLNRDDLKDQENYIYLQDFIKHIKEFFMKDNNLFTDKKTLEFYLENKSKIDYIINVYQEESRKIRNFIVENIVSEFPGFKVYDTAAFIQIFKDHWENYEHNGIHFEILPNKSFDELLGGKIELKFTLHNEKKTKDKYSNIVHKSYMQAQEFTFESNEEVQKSVKEILKQLQLMVDKYEVDIDTKISQKLIQG